MTKISVWIGKNVRLRQFYPEVEVPDELAQELVKQFEDSEDGFLLAPLSDKAIEKLRPYLETSWWDGEVDQVDPPNQADTWFDFEVNS